MRKEFFTDDDFQSLKGTWSLTRTVRDNGVDFATLTGKVDITALEGSPHTLLVEEYGTLYIPSQKHRSPFTAAFLYAARVGGIQIKRQRPILAEPPHLMHDLVLAPNGHGLVAQHTYYCPPDSYALTFRLTSKNLTQMNYAISGTSKSQEIISELKRH